MIVHTSLADEVSWPLALDIPVVRTRPAELQVASCYQALSTAIPALTDVVLVALGAAAMVD